MLVEMLLEELRRQRVLLPVPRVREMLVHQARTRAEEVSYHALDEGLTRPSLTPSTRCWHRNSGPL
jgi:hypothetical protein